MGGCRKLETSWMYTYSWLPCDAFSTGTQMMLITTKITTKILNSQITIRINVNIHIVSTCNRPPVPMAKMTVVFQAPQRKYGG